MTLSKYLFRAGWPDLGDKWTWRKRFGQWYVWIGPYVVGRLDRF